MERSLVLLKPDAIQRGLIGELIGRLEDKSLKISAMKLMNVSEDLARRHYEEHLEKDFFSDLFEFITSSPIVAMMVEGEQAIEVTRRLMGATNPFEAEPGTIRGDYGLDLTKNLIHGSDSAESAKREIDLFFDEEEILSYELTEKKWC
ncbi:nucleoside-diphosphate kinase [Candidatus Bipolaricaulota bacterium]|nr:nucleoside-diphosphate kinase [Candidatus Bipolaricaulota bacterium]MBS3825665.1 nucleoside-diphosphate kinase [Candidatus Bipolaricaulota bacterium]